jgi:hypothetical protein
MKKSAQRVRRGQGVALNSAKGAGREPYLKRIMPAALFWVAFWLFAFIIRLGLLAYDGDLPPGGILSGRTAAMLALIVAVSFATAAWMDWSNRRKRGRR